MNNPYTDMVRKSLQRSHYNHDICMIRRRLNQIIPKDPDAIMDWADADNLLSIYASLPTSRRRALLKLTQKG